MLTFTAEITDHCRRLDSFLQNLIPMAPAGYRHKLIRSGHLLVNGSPATQDTLLMAGDRLSLKESAKTGELLRKRLPDLDLLYEDDLLVIINKEAGLPVHKSTEDGDRNLVTLAEAYMAQRGTPVKLRPVNRLDRGTSGATLLAKSATSAGMFGRFVKEEGLGKVYLALAVGLLPAEGVIAEPLDGKESETSYRLLAATDGGSLAVVYPRTGRTHQIRKHLSMIGHPLLGDRRYGGPPLQGTAGHGLHAFAVSFRHPQQQEETTILAPLPVDLVRLCNRIAGSDWEGILVQLPFLAVTDTCRSTDPDPTGSGGGCGTYR